VYKSYIPFKSNKIIPGRETIVEKYFEKSKNDIYY